MSPMTARSARSLRYVRASSMAGDRPPSRMSLTDWVKPPVKGSTGSAARKRPMPSTNGQLSGFSASSRSSKGSSSVGPAGSAHDAVGVPAWGMMPPPLAIRVAVRRRPAADRRGQTHAPERERAVPGVQGRPASRAFLALPQRRADGHDPLARRFSLRRRRLRDAVSGVNRVWCSHS
jgi:hypothetical protein